MASRGLTSWIIRALLLAGLGVFVLPSGMALAQNTSRASGHVRVAAGDASSYAIRPDGSLWAWGANSLGELGLGNTNGHGVGLARLLPQRIGQSSSWRTLAAGSQFCLALRSDGSLWSWGANTLGALGIPAPPFGNHPRPTRVGSATWRAIEAGNEFSAGISRDGSLWTFGSNFLGELGIGSTKANSWVPTRVGGENDWKTIAVGYDWVLALKNDGSLWAWGGNDTGQLGIGSLDPAPDNEHPGVPHPTPIRIGTDTDWSAVFAGGSGSFALKRDGSLWAWGANGDGQLGVGDTLDHWIPTRVGTANDWQTLAAGSGYCLALKRNGSLWAWGENDSGQLGLGDTASRHRPTRVGHSTQWLRIAAGHASLAIRRDGTIWSWGDNFTGQLGLGDRHNRKVPTRITHLR